MMEELLKINNEILKHCEQTSRYDEHLFNLGVKFGRLLEQHKIQEQRPQAFLDYEIRDNFIRIKIKQKARIEKAISFFVRNAVAHHIEQRGEFTFDKNKSTELHKIAVDKFFVQTSSTNHCDESHLDVKFNLLGPIADIFEKYGIPKYANALISNTTGNLYETLYDADDVNEIFSVSVSINSHNNKPTKQQLDDMANELEKIIVAITLSLAKVR